VKKRVRRAVVRRAVRRRRVKKAVEAMMEGSPEMGTP